MIVDGYDHFTAVIVSEQATMVDGMTVHKLFLDHCNCWFISVLPFLVHKCRAIHQPTIITNITNRPIILVFGHVPISTNNVNINLNCWLITVSFRRFPGSHSLEIQKYVICHFLVVLDFGPLCGRPGFWPLAFFVVLDFGSRFVCQRLVVFVVLDLCCHFVGLCCLFVFLQPKMTAKITTQI